MVDEGKFRGRADRLPATGKIRILRRLPGIHPHGDVSDGLLPGLREMAPRAGVRPVRGRLHSAISTARTTF